MSALLDDYGDIVGAEALEHLRQLARDLQGLRVVHVNSTRAGGGVAEILHRLIPLMQELGIETSWEIVTGSADFYQCTKGFHNALQGNAVALSERMIKAYEEANTQSAEALRESLESADVVFIHDPQPAPLLGEFGERKGKWVWRCHIDVSHPYRQVWQYLKNHVAGYDASIFSLAAFAQPLPHLQYLISPSIDPLTEKNRELEDKEIVVILEELGIDPGRPIMLQVSRYDRFKDPLGVLQAYRLVKPFNPELQLVMAGGGADDDPEGAAVYDEVQRAANGAEDVHLLLLPPDAHKKINALQRAATIVLQKSVREGFGLTVTEGLWKGKPVIGGNTGGIRSQIVNFHTGFLVDTPEGAAMRTRYLLNHPNRREEMGEIGREFVREHFLITRHLREYLTLILAVVRGEEGRIELD